MKSSRQYLPLLSLAVITTSLITLTLWVQENRIRFSPAKAEEAFVASFGPKGQPSENWNTVGKLIMKLEETGAQPLEVFTYSGGFLNTLEDSDPIEPGVGYFIKFGYDPRDSFQTFLHDYTPVNSQIYSFLPAETTTDTPFGNLISIPEGVYQLLSNREEMTAEDLCYVLASYGVVATEIAQPDRNVVSQEDLYDELVVYNCHSPDNPTDFRVIPGEALFVYVDRYSSATLP